MDAVLGLAQALAASPWIYAVVFVVSTVDAFFPPVPSESVVVTLAALSASLGTPHPLLLGVVAFAGATLGDSLTFALGRAVGTERFAWMRTRRANATIAWARRGLASRAAVLIFTARYIPVGRVAVNLAAGATGLPYRRFLPLSLLATSAWATYSVGIGAVAGWWLHDYPLLGAALAVVIAAACGLVIDRLLTRRRRARALTPAPAPRGERVTSR